MKKLVWTAALSALLATVPLSGADAAPNYCYASKPAGEAGCIYKAPAAETVTLTGVGGWNVIFKHGKKIKTITSPNPEAPTSFQLTLAKNDTLTLSITHIGSAIVLVDGQ